MSSKAKQFRWALIAIAVILGALHAWAYRHAMNPDGISYLDIGEDFWNGNLGAIVNAHWSPLYPVILGLALKIFSPSPYWEFALAHGVNFLIFLFGLFAFDFFLRQVIATDEQKNQQESFPKWVWLGLGYGIFLITSLNFITLAALTPDMLVSGFLYLALGLLLKIRRLGERKAYLLLGVVLGISYLARAPMFLLAPLFIAESAFLGTERKKNTLNAALAFAIFLAVSMPFVAILSAQKGHFTFSESGRLNYAWHINKSVPYIGWLEGPHSPKQIFHNPNMFAFREPIRSTYPLWRDPAYWNEKVPVHLDLQGHLTAIKQGVHEISFITRRYLLPVAAAFLLLFLLGKVPAKKLLESWPLLVPVLVGIGMYALVYTASRYIAPFITALWLGLFLGLAREKIEKFQLPIFLMAIVLLWSIISFTNASEARLAAKTLRCGEACTPHHDWVVAETLREAGIKKGSRVGVIGHYFGAFGAYWARLARVQIVAEIPQGPLEQFWGKDKKTRREVIAAFGQAGAEAVVAEIVGNDIPPSVGTDGWRKVENTNWYYLLLKEPNTLVAR
ncbi:MAG: hypothetical protein AAB846_00630 [Patescibacteria group bacterium]